MKNKNNKILVILGPTAVGKSDLAVFLAKKYNGEVISADSRQVYKGLDIGTGKISKKEMRGVHHHLLDVISPRKTFSVADWKKMAEGKIESILKRNKLPIICGGTGFYIQSIVDGIILPEVPPNIELRDKLGSKSVEELTKILGKLDPNRLKNIDTKNKVRLIRAIEIAKVLGKVPEINEQKSPYQFLQIGININPKELRKKISIRLFARIRLGMMEEAKRLHKNGLSFKRMRELGLEYRYLADYFNKKITRKELETKLEIEIWRYAKRQMTWFKRPARLNSRSGGDKRIKWFEPRERNAISKKIADWQNT